jgi:hypothetical protein
MAEEAPKERRASVEDTTKYVIDKEMMEGMQTFSNLLAKKQSEMTAFIPSDNALAINEATTRVAPEWKEHIKTTLFSEELIRHRVSELAKQISEDYAGKEFIAVGLLNGGFVFTADLLRFMSRPYQLDFLSCSSYAGSDSTGSVKLKKDMSLNPYGKHVLIIEGEFIIFYYFSLLLFAAVYYCLLLLAFSFFL